MRHFRKLQCILVALLFILACIPIHTNAADPENYVIVGWRDLADWRHPGVAQGVKVRISGSNDWVDLKDENTLTVPPSSTVEVKVELENGYRLVKYGEGSLFLSTTQYSFQKIVNSEAENQITVPSANPTEDTMNLNVLFGSAKNDEKIIEEVTLNVTPPSCGTHVTTSVDPAPQISAPSGAKYKVMENSEQGNYKQWVEQFALRGADDNIYYEPKNDFDIVGGEKYFFEVHLAYNALPEEQALQNDHFTHPLPPTINIKNGKLIEASYVPSVPNGAQYGVDLKIIGQVTAKHVESDPEILNAILPTCTEAGSHDEKVICTACNKEVSYKSVVDDPIGHNWGKWKVIKEPTMYEEGKKQRICKNDSSHVQTKTIPCLDSCTVTFDVQGHGTAPEAQQIEVGKTATEPTNMYAAGFVFGGWYTDPECTTPFDFETPITEDITLYANWIPSAYGFLGTGDGANTLLWFSLLGVSLASIAFIEIKKKYQLVNKKIK